MRGSRSLGFPVAVCFLMMISALAMACGPLGGGDEDNQGGEENTQSGPPAVSSTDDVQGATVYIQAAGGVYDQGRTFGETVVGQGSGFIIDPSGIAVTNNHVVAGAGFLEVYVGDETEPRSAKILGRSECSDLAVIDIDEGGYPYLEWRDGEIEANLDVRAAGFPAEDEDPEERNPDYTITRGTINTTEADGESDQSSVESVLEHDAMIQGGNSGGPLVDERGKVVGVNYAGRIDPETGADTGQQFAISRDEAQDILAELEQGRDVNSLGINGIAYGDPDLSGIAVVSTVTGSPADTVGVRNFVVNEANPDLPQELDIITKIEGTTLGENSTLEEYCDVLRGRGSPDQPLSIEVLRSSFDEAGEPVSIVRYEGTLNGGPEGKLQEVETLLEPTPEPETGSGDTGSSDYTEVSDDSGDLTVEVPSSWSEVDGRPGPIFEGEEDGPAVTASPDVEGYYDSYSTPGVDVRVSSSVLENYDQNTVLEGFDRSEQCELANTEQDEANQVAVNYWANCGGVEGQEVVDTAFMDPNGAYLVLVTIQLVNEPDSAATVERIIGSLGLPE